MYRITISTDRNPGQYEVTVERRRLFFWSLIKRYRGPYTWITQKAEKLKEQYQVPAIINKVTLIEKV